jgi:hypothetical protein
VIVVVINDVKVLVTRLFNSRSVVTEVVITQVVETVLVTMIGTGIVI